MATKRKIKQTTQEALIKMLEAVNGMTFISIDTDIIPEMDKMLDKSAGIRNPHYGRVHKTQIGSSVMVFQNKRINGYEAMVQRRLAQEGKDPFDFKLSPRRWGTRVENMPLVTHNGGYYLEVIFLHPGPVQYYLDDKPVPEERIIGLRKSYEPAQGGLERKVILRCPSFDSIRRIKIDGNEYTINK